MALPELDIARVRRWCASQIPEQFRDEVLVECDIAPRHLTIVECRPPWREDLGPERSRRAFARLRYVATRGEWELLWPDRNDRWHRYPEVAPSNSIQDLINEIDRDPTGIFRG